jgi:hypothetical protein
MDFVSPLYSRVNSPTSATATTTATSSASWMLLHRFLFLNTCAKLPTQETVIQQLIAASLALRSEKFLGVRAGAFLDDESSRHLQKLYENLTK